MWSTDRITSVVLLSLSALYTAAGWELPTWASTAPGPGFMPRLLALVLAGLAIGIWIEGRPTATPQIESAVFSTREPLIIFSLVLVYVFALPQLGFPFASFLLVLALRRFIEPASWWGDLAGAIVGPLVIHVVFVQILALQLPVFPVWWER
jgi:hypothetical protein